MGENTTNDVFKYETQYNCNLELYCDKNYASITFVQNLSIQLGCQKTEALNSLHNFYTIC